MSRKHHQREQIRTPRPVWIVGLLILVIGVGSGIDAAVAQTARPDSLVLDVRAVPLAEALGQAADVMRLDLAFAPEGVHGKVANCRTPLPPAEARGGEAAEVVLRCVLQGTELEARRVGEGAFVVARPASALSADETPGVVHGVIRDRTTDSVLVDVNVRLIGTARGDATNRRGEYRIDRVPPGRYVLRASRVGFLPVTIGSVHVRPADTVRLNVGLSETAIRMEDVVVSPRIRTESFVRGIAQTIPAAGYQSVGMAGVNVGLLVSVNGERTGRAQFSPLGNIAGTDLRGVQLSGGVNATAGSAYGVQLSGVGNLAGVGVHGVQIGGAVNGVEGTLRGVQVSNSVNLAYGAAVGLQLGGGVNVAGRLRGGQIGGAVNVATASMEGVQITGGLNVGHEVVRGVQITGGINLARRRIAGVQVAPFNIAGTARGLQVGVINVARRRIAGVQVAPLSIAGTVRGLQVGVINVARRHRGVPIGVVSYVHDVGLRYDTWTTESGMTTVALRSGTRHISSFFGMAVRPQAATRQLASMVGLGVALAPARRLSAGLDVLSYTLFNLPEKEPGSLFQARLTTGYDVGGGFSIAAGPTFNFWTGQSDGSEMVRWAWASGRLAGESYRLGPGFVVGLRFAR